MKLLAVLIALASLGLFTVGAQSSSICSSTSSSVIYQYAPWYCSQANQAIANYWVQYEPIAFLAILLSFSVAVLLFAISAFLRSERLRNFAVGEFYEAAATTLIVVAFLFVTAVIVGLLPSLILANTNPYVSSLNYISGTITSTQGLITQMLQITIADKYYASLNLQLCSPIVSDTTCISNLLGYLTPAITVWFVVPAQTISALMFDGVMLLYGEFYLIMIMMYAAIPVFLIPGIIFRAILPLRNLGGMMIAIAIGGFVIMPTLFSVAFYFTNTALQGQIASTTASLARYGTGSGAQLNAISQQSPLVQTLGQINTSLSAFWMSVLFYPSLIFALTYIFITETAKFIGGATKFSGRLRIV